jgi:hypothetical protein
MSGDGRAPISRISGCEWARPRRRKGDVLAGEAEEEGDKGGRCWPAPSLLFPRGPCHPPSLELLGSRLGAVRLGPRAEMILDNARFPSQRGGGGGGGGDGGIKWFRGPSAR